MRIYWIGERETFPSGSCFLPWHTLLSRRAETLATLEEAPKAEQFWKGLEAVEVTYLERDENPPVEANELVLAMIRHASTDLSWTRADGVSTVKGHLSVTDG